MSVETPISSKATQSLDKISSSVPFFEDMISRATAVSSINQPFGRETERGRVFVQQRSSDRQGVSASLYTVRSEKTFRALTVNNKFAFTPLFRNLTFWRSVLAGDLSVGGKFTDEHYLFEHEAGKLEDPEDQKNSLNTNHTLLVVKINEGQEPKLVGAMQQGLLTNPNRESEGLDLETNLSMDAGKPKFSFDFKFRAPYKGKNVITHVKKTFVFDEERNAHLSFGARGFSEEEMPEFISASTQEDLQRKRFADAHARRIYRLTPNEFSEQEVDQILSNIIEGRVATTGVWNPLEALPELRKASAPKKS